MGQCKYRVGDAPKAADLKGGRRNRCVDTVQLRAAVQYKTSSSSATQSLHYLGDIRQGGGAVHPGLRQLSQTTLEVGSPGVPLREGVRKSVIVCSQRESGGECVRVICALMCIIECPEESTGSLMMLNG
jgi:hypothetical protein